MDPTLLIVIVILVVAGAGLPLILTRRAERASFRDDQTEAVNALLAGEPRKALERLRDIAKGDTGNVDLYLQIGALYRQLDQLDAAIRVHADVLHRDHLKPAQRLLVEQHLTQDYEAQADYPMALQHAEELARLDRRNVWAAKAIHRIQVQMKNWEGALRAYQRETSLTRESNDQLPAMYRTAQGKALLAKGKQQEALNAFKQAIKLSNACPAPYYHLGKALHAKGNLKHAIDYFTTFAELDPSAGSIIFSDLEKMYFELGQFEQVEQFYKRLHKSQPDNMEVLLGLAQYYERKGEVREALAVLEEAGEEPRENLSFTLGRLHLLEKLGREAELRKTIDDVVGYDRAKRILTCPACGHIAEEPVYLCAECGHARTT